MNALPAGDRRALYLPHRLPVQHMYGPQQRLQELTIPFARYLPSAPRERLDAHHEEVQTLRRAAAEAQQNLELAEARHRESCLTSARETQRAEQELCHREALWISERTELSRRAAQEAAKAASLFVRLEACEARLEEHAVRDQMRERDLSGMNALLHRSLNQVSIDGIKTSSELETETQELLHAVTVRSYRQMMPLAHSLDPPAARPSSFEPASRSSSSSSSATGRITSPDSPPSAIITSG